MAENITARYKRKVVVLTANTVKEVKTALKITQAVNVTVNGARTTLSSTLNDYQHVTFRPRTAKTKK